MDCAEYGKEQVLLSADQMSQTPGLDTAVT